MGEWTWKDPDQGTLTLRYEPGNWGDILKGEWLCLWLEWFASQGGQRLSYRDPFCGQVDYPLSLATRKRLEMAPTPRYRRWCQERLPSSASLVQLEAGRLGLQLESHLSDRHQDPLENLQDHHLVLFDPYDFFEQWPEWTPRLLQLSEQQSLLIYLYNKSPRGAGQFRNYQHLCQSWAQKPRRVGRVAADARLPRAYHEVWLVGSGAGDPELAEQLRQVVVALHGALAEAAIWESWSA